MGSSPRVVLGPEGGRFESWDDATRGRIDFRTIFSSEHNGTTGLTVGVAELAPGERLNVHRHAPAEVYHVLEGQGLVTLDAEEHPVQPGSAVYIAGDAWHGIRNTGPLPLRFHYVLAADGMGDVEYDFDDQRRSTR
jgi:quercetin dioxygenase-like cupin family protein